MTILDFSVYGWHGFGSVTQVCFGISVSNFMCMSFVAVGRSLTIVSYVAFKIAALWFWTMFSCNPPIAHCHPLLWGGGILVDHWSTISSLYLTNLLCHFSKSIHNTVVWKLKRSFCIGNENWHAGGGQCWGNHPVTLSCLLSHCNSWKIRYPVFRRVAWINEWVPVK